MLPQIKKLTLIFIAVLLSVNSMHAQKTAEEAKTYFSSYKSTNTIMELISTSLPTLEECKFVFKEEFAQTYLDYANDMKGQLANSGNIKNEDFVDIGIETFTIQDLKDFKGNYAGGMTSVLPKLNDGLTFFKVEQLRTVGAERGISYNYWVYIRERWVFFPKPWRAFKEN
ncbi:MAG: hypothetical protein Q8M29_13425 [Bacteroidota bacterium]|nr:hypothetical protein [Bacteroidota bacterium]